MNLEQIRWLSTVLLMLCVPCALGYTSNSVWSPHIPGRDNFPPISGGSIYTPGPPQKHMPRAPLPYKYISYYHARQIIVKHGWKPRPIEDVPGNTTYKCGNPKNDRSLGFNEVCKKFPEISAISESGFCKMRFYKNMVQLNVFVYGYCDSQSLSDKNYDADTVVGWEVVHFTDY